MAERLTECIDSHLLDNGEMVKEYSLNSKIKLNHFSCMDIPNAVYDKLGELEDILEKYGVESLDTLEHIIKKGKVIIAVAENVSIYEEIQKDRNTWKRACELMGKKLLELYCSDYCGNNKDCNNCKFKDITSPQYFYQQAKNKDSKQC